MGIIALLLLAALVVAGWYILRLRRDVDKYVDRTAFLLADNALLEREIDNLRRRNRGLRNGNVNLFRQKTAYEATIGMLLGELERSA